MMVCGDFTEEGIICWVLRKLGADYIDVELSEQAIKDAICDTLVVFNKNKPIVRHSIVDVSQGSVYPSVDLQWDWWTTASNPTTTSYRYELTNYGRGLFQVTPESRSSLELSLGFGFQVPIEHRITGFEMEKYESYLMWQEEIQNTYSTRFEWKFIAPYLYVVNIPFGTRQLSYSYFDSRKIDDIPMPWQYWFQRFVLALVKEIVAEVRGKFASIPSSGGGVQMDASELRNEAQQERERLIEKLENSRGDLPPSWG